MQGELGDSVNSISTPIFCSAHHLEGVSTYKLQGVAGLARQPNRRNFTLKVTNVPKLKKGI
jgi:hypothetical protein